MIETRKMTRELPFSLENISGLKIEQNVIALAKIGGTPLESTENPAKRYAVNRLALSDEDFQARDYLSSRMESAGMKIHRHPLGLIGYYAGEDESLPPVVIQSHFDSVPNAGMYDGTVGVVTGIEVVDFLKRNSIKTKRSIIVVAQTGEESSGFDAALFGSKGMTMGLSEEDLAKKSSSSASSGLTIKEALETQGQDIDITRRPYFEQNSLHAVIELHQSQDERLKKSGIDMAIIENIAAPQRLKITIGTRPKILSVKINGKTGHSGATPMGRENRADGLVVMADITTYIRRLEKKIKKEMGKDLQISIENLSIDGAAMNKIPGLTNAQISISSEDGSVITRAEEELRKFIGSKNKELLQSPTNFDENPIIISKADPKTIRVTNPSSAEMEKRQSLAGMITKYINSLANKGEYKDNKNVGTVGTYKVDNGQIILGVDIRGIDKKSRDKMVLQLKSMLGFIQNKGIQLEYEMADGGDPTATDKRLVNLAEQVIEENNIGSVIKDFSPAGHDSQNYARVGHPAVLVFIPSENDGSHTPIEYSKPESLQKGAQAMAALVYNLAMEN